MTNSDIARLEQELAVQLPTFYKSVLRDYPFPDDSYVAESLLWNDLKLLVDRNKDLSSIVQSASPGPLRDAKFFQIGFDGGEEIYLIDLRSELSPIYVYDFESSAITEKSSNIDAWLAKCRQAEAEVLADEMEMEKRRVGKRWWQFWK